MSVLPNPVFYRISQTGCSVRRLVGFTLMEVLIAMAIGLVVLIGAFSYFGSGIKAMQTNDAYARMHESASKVANIITRDIQLAGFYGYGGTASQTTILSDAGIDYGRGRFVPPYPSVTASVTYNNDCDENNLFALDRPLEYYASNLDAADSSKAPVAYPATCFPNIVAGSPILIVRGALTGNSWVPSASNDTHYVNNTVLVTSSPFSGTTLPRTAFFFGNPATGTSFPNYTLYHAWQAGLIHSRANGKRIPIFPYQFHVYYIRSCNLEATSGTDKCDVSKGADTIPTLVRRQINPASSYEVDLVTVRLIPGVEQMHFIWGMDTQGDTDITSGRSVGDGVTDYWSSSSLPSSDFNRVNSVRMQILVQATATDVGYDDSDNTYFFEGKAVGYNCGSSVDACRRRRLLFEATTSLRNCSLRRRGGLIDGGGC